MSKFSDIFKKILPTIVSTYIPGTSDLTKAAIAAATSKATGGSTEDALLSGIGTYAAGKYGIPPMTGTVSTINPTVGIVPDPSRYELVEEYGDIGNEFYRDKVTGKIIPLDQIPTNTVTTTTGGIPSASGTPDFIKKIGDYFGFGGKSGLEDAYGKESMFGNFPGGAMGMAGIGLLGKAVYDDTKRKQGGLADTPQVSMDSLGRYQLANALGTGGTREEFGLSPKPVSFDFDAMNQPVAAAGGGLISRQYFSEGGIAELDMREGGESEGPGTGTSDDVPAMLSDGEFVMTAAATKGAGAYDLNKTKKGIELIKTTDSDRERGVTNMRELMNIFEAV